jgi:phosphoglycerate dehydrogenase-like enzyme
MTETKGAIRVLSTVNLNHSQAKSVQQISPRLVLNQVNRSSEHFRPLLARAEILLTHFQDTGFDPELVPRLKWIQLTSASVERIFEQPIINTDVTITNSSGIHAAPIAEYVFASMLAFSRKLPELLRRQQRRHWSSADEVYAQLMGTELRGATLGVLGYGSIGREVARLGAAFGMRVLACKKDPAKRIDPGWQLTGLGDPEGTIPESFYGMEQLHEFLFSCDYIVLACPLTAETTGVIDAAALKAMRPNAFLVNVGRGKLLDETALVSALKEGRIAGAGLDVATIEPLPPESELFDLPNLILTPHCSGTTPKYDDRATELFCDNLSRYLQGQRLLNEISREHGY